MSDIQIRHTVESLFAIRCKVLESAKKLWETEKELKDEYEEINGYSPYSVENSNRIYAENTDQKSIDQNLWRYQQLLLRYYLHHS